MHRNGAKVELLDNLKDAGRSVRRGVRGLVTRILPVRSPAHEE
jgi:hypothetical protein